jgi:hypothetical protein
MMRLSGNLSIQIKRWRQVRRGCECHPIVSTRHSVIRLSAVLKLTPSSRIFLPPCRCFSQEYVKFYPKLQGIIAGFSAPAIVLKPASGALL